MSEESEKSQSVKNRISFWWRMVVLAGGFGLGGLIWGWEAYRGTVGSEETFTNPFSYILGAVSLAVFGGLALAYLSQKNGSFSMSRSLVSKKTLKIVGLGIVGWLVAFLMPAVWVEWMATAGGVAISVLFAPFSETSDFVNTALPYLKLEQDLKVTLLIFEFAVSGAIVGLVYSFMLKAKVIKTILYGAAGFALASLIGPVLGNIIGNLFDSLYASYLLTFLIIGVILGLSLSFGVNKEEKEGSMPT